MWTSNIYASSCKYMFRHVCVRVGWGGGSPSERTEKDHCPVVSNRRREKEERDRGRQTETERVLLKKGVMYFA